MLKLRSFITKYGAKDSLKSTVYFAIIVNSLREWGISRSTNHARKYKQCAVLS